jgi:hypothetical protein
MKTRRLAGAIAVAGMGLFLAPASASAANGPVCIGELGSSAGADMANITVDWRNDFLGVGQTAGGYASFLAQHRAPECPQ